MSAPDPQARDDLYRVAALLWQLDRFLDPTPHASPTPIRLEGELPPRLPPTGTALAGGTPASGWMEAPARRARGSRRSPVAVPWVEPADVPSPVEAPDPSARATPAAVPADVPPVVAPPGVGPPLVGAPEAAPAGVVPPAPAAAGAGAPDAAPSGAAPQPPTTPGADGPRAGRAAPDAPIRPAPPTAGRPARAQGSPRPDPAAAGPTPLVPERSPGDRRPEPGPQPVDTRPRPDSGPLAAWSEWPPTAPTAEAPRQSGLPPATLAAGPRSAAAAPPVPAGPPPGAPPRGASAPERDGHSGPGAEAASAAFAPPVPPRVMLVEAAGVVPTDVDLARPTTPPWADEDDSSERPPPAAGATPAVQVRRRGVPAGSLSRAEARRLEEELRRRFLDRPGRTP